MILDAKVLTLVNPAVWRQKLGVGEPGLEDWSARLAALETAVDQLQAVLANWLARAPGLSVLSLPEGPALHYDWQGLDQWHPLFLWSEQTGRYYRLQPVRADDGSLNFELWPADVLRDAEGRRWRLQVIHVDGEPNLELTEET